MKIRRKLWFKIVLFIATVILGISTVVFTGMTAVGFVIQKSPEAVEQFRGRVARQYVVWAADQIAQKGEGAYTALEKNNVIYKICKDATSGGQDNVYCSKGFDKNMDVDSVLFGDGWWGNYETLSLAGAISTNASMAHYIEDTKKVISCDCFLYDKNANLFYIKASDGINYPLRWLLIKSKNGREQVYYYIEGESPEESFYYCSADEESEAIGENEIGNVSQRKLTAAKVANASTIMFINTDFVWEPGADVAVCMDNTTSIPVKKEAVNWSQVYGGAYEYIYDENAEVTIETNKNTNWNYEIQYYVDTNYNHKDLLSTYDGFVKWLQKTGVNLGLAIASLIGFVVGVFFLFAGAGRTAAGEVKLGWFDRIPWLVEIIVAVCMVDACIYGGITFIKADIYKLPEGIWIPLLIFDACIALAIIIRFVYGFIARVRSKEFFKHTLIYYILIPIRKLVHFVQKNVKLVGGVLGGMVLLTIVETIVAHSMSEGASVIIFVFKIFETPLVIWLTYQLNILRKGAKRVAAGDVTHPINTKHLFWHLKEHGEAINNVGDGINAAVEERMKSERFKTELITNVSHDIKTPLTSIINYVDLLEKEDINDPKILEYVEVLHRQSARLKKLIEDLMEASKASTGNLEVHLENCDVNVFLTQTIGEFEERANAKGIELLVNSDAREVNIWADGRHLWRIFDNLLNNACKYSSEGTRIYVDLQTGEESVMITFRNISKEKLNISSEELMERFVRGDSSRNTEGSGLGLSIARSLTELMQGTMKVQIDGDLFKVILKFPRGKVISKE